MKKSLISLLVSAAMVIGPLPALAAEAVVLAPGAAAGVVVAQDRDDFDNPPVIWLIGFGVVVAVGILLLTQNSHGNSLTQVPTTTTNQLPPQH